MAQQNEFVLAGSVVNSKTGEPVKRALVTAFRFGTPDTAADASETLRARPAQPFSASALTDASGSFRFTGLPAGSYNLSAQKPHLTESPTGRETVRLESSSKEDVRIALSPLGTIEGTIIDQRGQPVPGASVSVIQTAINDGRRQSMAVRTVSTDDRGVFRVWDIAPGRYLVKAAGHGGMTYAYLDEIGPSNGGFVGFVPTYFGGATADSATPIVMESGTEARADIGVVVQATHKVRGSLANFGGGDVQFSLLSGDENVATGRVNFSRATGAFEMLEVVNGSYTLRALQGNLAIAELPITVEGADITGVQMALAGPVEIPVNARILDEPEVIGSQESSETAEGQASQRPIQAQVRGFCQVILLDAGSAPQLTASQNQPNGPVSALPGKYRVQANCNNAYLVSVAMGNADLLENPWITVAPGAVTGPIEIVGHYGGGMISGAIKLDQSPAGKPVAVLAVPAAASREPVFAPIYDQAAGQFAFYSLAPGDYTLYAFSTDQIEYRNPDFLHALSGGESVQIADGVTATATLTRLTQ